MGPAAEHAVHSEQLVLVMRSLGRLARDRLPQELDVRSERRRRAGEIAAIARAMSASATVIPHALEGVELEPDEREAFHGLAAKLGDQARALEARAVARPTADLSANLARMRQTCIGCHRRFRLGGDIGDW